MIKLRGEKAVGHSTGKLILVGEHSVVYHQPAIALSFPLVEVKAIVEKAPDGISLDSSYYVGPLNNVPEKLQGIVACIEETLKHLNQPATGLRIKLDSTIPLGRGLGSSAAIAIALVKSLFNYFLRQVSKQELMDLVHLAETYAHGNPSGIDMEAAISDQPLWFEKDKGTKPLELGGAFHLVVADTGRIGDTHAAVASIKAKFKSQPQVTQTSINRLGEITLKAGQALSSGDSELLGESLNSAQMELDSLGVSDQGINQLVETARKLGALGAKLTGGGRGGCVLALAKNGADAALLANGLKDAGAHQTWFFTLEKN
ncbi:mevalonate kinase [Aquibacillus halophilus]|uniref:mevalonate kinase n=1 Tax=Aquibacillus halophilus TaxID=930132 RepID=A0A6A8DN33_9BACI|nr:mevalonate kinase [Aquibacillus halophilus]MRH44437.1 mevalonate kinase [Aquibacillus halophilus]